MKDKKFYPWVVVGLLWVVALLNLKPKRLNVLIQTPKRFK